MNLKFISTLHRWHRILFVLPAISATFSCTTPKQATETSGVPGAPAVAAPQLAEDDPRRRAATEKFIDATKMDILGDHQQAINLYKESLKTIPLIRLPISISPRSFMIRNNMPMRFRMHLIS